MPVAQPADFAGKRLMSMRVFTCVSRGVCGALGRDTSDVFTRTASVQRELRARVVSPRERMCAAERAAEERRGEFAALARSEFALCEFGRENARLAGVADGDRGDRFVVRR